MGQSERTFDCRAVKDLGYRNHAGCMEPAGSGMEQPLWRYRLGREDWAAALLEGPGAPAGYWCTLRPETASAIPLL